MCGGPCAGHWSPQLTITHTHKHDVLTLWQQWGLSSSWCVLTCFARCLLMKCKRKLFTVKANRQDRQVFLVKALFFTLFFCQPWVSNSVVWYYFPLLVILTFTRWCTVRKHTQAAEVESGSDVRAICGCFTAHCVDSDTEETGRCVRRVYRVWD